MFRYLALLALGFTLSASVYSQQRPLLTDDVDIIPTGAVELGIGIDFLQNAKFPLSGLEGDITRVGDFRIRGGFAANVEFQVEGSLQNFLSVDSRKTPSPIPLKPFGNSTNDFEDFSLSAKIKLRNESGSMPAIGFKFGFQMPNTDQAKGIGTNQINIFSKIIVQKTYGRQPGKQPAAKIFGNIGLGIMNAPVNNFTQNDVLLYGLAGVFRVTDNVNLVSEVNGRANTRSGPAPLGTESQGQIRIGTQIRASGLRFDSAAVFGITRNSPDTGIVFGVTYESGSFFPVAK